MAKVPSLKRADRYVHGPDDVVTILVDGTLLNTKPVQRMVDRGMDVPEEWIQALKKTQDRDNEQK